MNGKIRCLFIDDDLDDQEIFQMVLGDIDSNIECITANDGVEGLRLLDSDHKLVPDFIFVDVNMPKMNGIECLKHIKELNHLTGSKVIMYSTTSETRLVDIARSLGATEFVVKPAAISKLREILLRILGKS